MTVERGLRALAVATLIASSSAMAQAPAVTVGTRVTHTSGADVGTVTAVAGGTATIKTDKHEVQLPVTSFTTHEGKLLVAMTREQMNAEVERSLATARASLVPGVTVVGTGGNVIGTLAAIDDHQATLKLTSGKLVKVARSGIAPAPQGAVVGISAEQLQAAADAAAQGT